MKLLIFLALTISLSLSITTESQQKCLGKKQIECDSACSQVIALKCGDGSDVKNSSQCEYIDKKENGPKSVTENWSEKYGENFQGCMSNCVSEVSGDAKTFMTAYLECSAQVIGFALFSLFLVLLL